MTARFNHTIVYADDREAAAAFITELFGLGEAKEIGPFLAVPLADDVALDYAQQPAGQPVVSQHYAFLVDDDEFDAVYTKIRDRNMAHWADPRKARPGEVNNHDGGRGVYFLDPSGHQLEMITSPLRTGQLTQLAVANWR